MKKIYMQPALVVQKIATHKMICTSAPSVTVDSTESVNANEVGSRYSKYNVWDDEEEDDDE